VANGWRQSSERIVPNVNPANTDVILGTVRQATRSEAKQAVEAAAEAFSAWRASPHPNAISSLLAQRD
jgi:aldehyde dehydrogenase (NAD+)